MAVEGRRFGNVEAGRFEEAHAHSKNTKNSTKFGVKVFKDFLKERGVSTDILSLTEDELDNRLQNLYSNIKSQKSDAYKINTILCIRQSLNHYFRESGKKFDIIRDANFTAANKCFKALQRKIRIDGKGSVKQYLYLTLESCIIMNTYLILRHLQVWSTRSSLK
jgi:site-specific recombinase XerD